MMADCVELFKSEQPQVYSNMAGLRCPEAVYVDGAAGFLTLYSGLVLLDEVGVFFGSRTWQQRTEAQLASFAQVRKNGLDLLATTQHESRVDTVIRENSSEWVRCRRIGNWILSTTSCPHSKQILRRRVQRLRPAVWSLYETLEVIGSTGRSDRFGVELGAVPLSVVARRRQAQNAQRAAAARRRVEAVSIWRPGPELRFTREAQAAADWLADIGWCTVLGQPVAAAVHAEVLRRRWLRAWGLKPADAPLTCSPDAPWLRGFSPAEVIARADAEAELEAAEALVSASRKAARRAPAALRVSGG